MPIRDYQVLQREPSGKAHVQLETGELLELAVGGPYEVGGAHDVLVGDIWVLAGQSNMEGVGDLVDVEMPSPFVHLFQSCEEWAVAEEPLHWLTESPQPIHHLLLGREPLAESPALRDANRSKGAGLGLPFAKRLHERSGVPIGLIASAHGGTSMDQWDPALKDQGGRSLYGAMLRRIAAVGGLIAGVLWYQGESDATPEALPLYRERMLAFVQALRRDLGQPDLPFYYVQIGRVVIPFDMSAQAWNGIREEQRILAATLSGTAMVSAIDTALDDLIHVSTQDLKRLGKRLADVVSGEQAPNLVSVTVDVGRISVRFAHVRGGLRAHGRPAGFSLRDAEGQELLLLYKVTLEGDAATLYFTPTEIPVTVDLWYGWGLDPYCNIIDAADAAVPAFGPVPVTLLP